MSLINMQNIPLKDINPSPYQTRFDFNDIESLARNIKEIGLQQPIIVRKRASEKFELVSGARRLEAARLLGWKSICSIVKEVSNFESARICLSENLQRENLNPIEEARGYMMLRDMFNLTHSQVAGKVGKSRSYVTNSLSLLKIDEFLQACLIFGELTISHIRIINTAPDDVEKYRLADIAMDWKLSVKELNDVVDRLHKKEKLLFWTRNIPIEKIRIPFIAYSYENGDCEEGAIIVDPSMVLLGGRGSLWKARRSGEEVVEVEVVYYSEWLDPSGWISEEQRSPIDPTGTLSSKFSKILAELVGGTEEMYQRYPIHLINDENDYYTIQHISREK